MSYAKLELIYEPSSLDMQDNVVYDHFSGKIPKHKTLSQTKDNFMLKPYIDFYNYREKPNFSYLKTIFHDIEIKSETDKFYLHLNDFLYEKYKGNYCNIKNNYIYNTDTNGINVDYYYCSIKGNLWNVITKKPKKNVELLKTSQDIEFYYNKIHELNYSFLRMEIEKIQDLNFETKIRHADLIEKVLDLIKLNTDNIIQKRIYEILQWDMIQIKNNIFEHNNEEFNENLEKIIKKLHDIERINKLFPEMIKIEEKIFSESNIRILEDGRVKITWKKS